MNTSGRLRIGIAGVLLSAATAFGVIGVVRAAAPGSASSLVPITPCRMVDTRATEAVGSRSTPIGPSQPVTFDVWGTNGNCTIPNTAVGIVTNTTAVGPTDDSYLTVWPGDAEQPLTSNLNWLRTSPPTPNQVTVGLSATGTVKVFNRYGSVDIIIDIVGYYVAPAAQKPADVYVTKRSSTVLLSASGGPNGATTVNAMLLPAGTYLLTFSATLVNFAGSDDFFRCSLYSAGASIAGNTVLLGPSAGAVATMTVQGVATLTFAGTTAVGSSCLHDGNLPGNAFYLDPGATLSAMPITVR